MTKKDLEKKIKFLYNVVEQNGKESQRFCNEQLNINKIVSNFKNAMDLRIPAISGQVDHLQSVVDKEKNAISDLIKLDGISSEMFTEYDKELDNIKEFCSMIIDTFKLKLVETPAVEKTLKLVAEKEVVKSKKLKK